MCMLFFMEVDIGKTCDSCQARGLEATNAIVFCTTCNEFYCSLCTDYHKGFKLTRDHVLVDANTRLNSDSKKGEGVCGITHDDESGSDFEGFVKLENTSTQQEPEQGVGEMSLKMAQVHVSTENEKPEIYIETEAMNQETSSEIYIEGGLCDLVNDKFKVVMEGRFKTVMYFISFFIAKPFYRSLIQTTI